MRRLDLMARLHELLRPRTYFEVGVNLGVSLAQSRTRTVAVDPFFEVRHELHCDLHLVRTTSDEFFARDEPFAHFDEPLIDLAFIDGMHLAEYVLRDVVNTERYTHPASVIVLDDMLPRHPDMAGRDRTLGRQRGAWTGDIYKILPDIRALRPDLVCIEVDTLPTGLVILLGPDAANRRLVEAAEELVESYVTPDPQDVPVEVLQRTRALDGDELMSLPVWEGLRRLQGADPAAARAGVRELLSASGLDRPTVVST